MIRGTESRSDFLLVAHKSLAGPFPTGRMKRVVEYIRSLFTSPGRRQLYEELQWQRFVLRTGVQATVKVLDMVEEPKTVYGYRQVRLWVMFRVRENITYRHVQTVIRKESLPVIGDTIQVRFCPDDVKNIIII